MRYFSFFSLILLISLTVISGEKNNHHSVEENFQEYQKFFSKNFPDQKIDKNKFLKYLNYAENFHEIANEYDYRKRKNQLTPKFENFYQENKNFMMRHYKHFLLSEIDRDSIGYDEYLIIDEFRNKRNYDLIKSLSNTIAEKIESIDESEREDRTREHINKIIEDGEKNGFREMSKDSQAQ